MAMCLRGGHSNLSAGLLLCSTEHCARLKPAGTTIAQTSVLVLCFTSVSDTSLSCFSPDPFL